MKYIYDENTPVLISISDIESISVHTSASGYCVEITGVSRKEYYICNNSTKAEAEEVFAELLRILSQNESTTWNRLNPIIYLKDIKEAIAKRKENETQTKVTKDLEDIISDGKKTL